MNQTFVMNLSKPTKNCYVFTTVDGKNILYLQKSFFNGEIPEVIEVSTKKH